MLNFFGSYHSFSALRWVSFILDLVGDETLPMPQNWVPYVHYFHVPRSAAAALINFLMRTAAEVLQLCPRVH